jgi:hypothetical protein
VKWHSRPHDSRALTTSAKIFSPHMCIFMHTHQEPQDLHLYGTSTNPIPFTPTSRSCRAVTCNTVYIVCVM